MDANAKAVNLTLNITAGSDVTLEESDDLIRQLHAEIREIEVESVGRLSYEEKPAGFGRGCHGPGGLCRD